MGKSEPGKIENHFLSGMVEFSVERRGIAVCSLVVLLQIKFAFEKPLLPASEVICLNIGHKVQNCIRSNML